MPAKKIANTPSTATTGHPVEVYSIGEGGRWGLIYASDVKNPVPTERDAWLTAQRSKRFHTAASAGHVAGLLQQLGVAATTTTHAPSDDESFQVVTPEAPVGVAANLTVHEWEVTATPGKSACRWRPSQAIVLGGRSLVPDTPDERLLNDKAIPLVVFDYRQGLLQHASSNWPTSLQTAAEQRTYIIRTHDPVTKEWKELRRRGSATTTSTQPRHTIWFSPLQDLASGELLFPGTWRSVGDAVRAYLQSDDTLFSGKRWLTHVIVQVGVDGGAFWAEADTGNFRAFKFAGTQPGTSDWNARRAVVGGSVMFITALAKALVSTPTDLTPAVIQGVASLRRLQELGYLAPGLVGTKERSVALPGKRTMPLFLPVEAITTARASEVLEDHALDCGSWSVAKELCCADPDRYVRHLTLRVGDLDVVDPEYAEALLSIVERLRQFQKRWAASRGDAAARVEILSLGIYGGPGSGKSFVAKQLAKAADPGGKSFEALTFNVSQFASMSDLAEAFERIRAVSAKGLVPLVLWDEFDTQWEGQKGGWLARFLMPMQDAKFVADGEVRSLDSAVFVFIGGTFAGESEFKRWMETPDGRRNKAVDFHSRLAAAFAVPTIHVGTPITDETRERELPWKAQVDPLGQYVVKGEGTHTARVNRAVLLRSYLRKTRVRRIELEVLAFLLHVPLRHGARSLEQLVKECSLDGAEYFRSFHLPSKHVLELHVERTLFEVAADDANRQIVPALLHAMGLEGIFDTGRDPVQFAANQ